MKYIFNDRIFSHVSFLLSRSTRRTWLASPTTRTRTSSPPTARTVCWSSGSLEVFESRRSHSAAALRTLDTALPGFLFPLLYFFQPWVNHSQVNVDWRFWMFMTSVTPSVLHIQLHVSICTGDYCFFTFWSRTAEYWQLMAVFGVWSVHTVEPYFPELVCLRNYLQFFQQINHWMCVLQSNITGCLWICKSRCHVDQEVNMI